MCTCAHGFLFDSKVRAHLAGMNTSHSGDSTAGKRDGWAIYLLLSVVTFPPSPAEASVPSSAVLLRR